MGRVTSADGTVIAFERLGAGPLVVVVGGALADGSGLRPLAEELAGSFTVINYDRRGRGDSGDTAPYTIEREVEDLAALIAEAGGSAAVYGHSSGAALAMYAAAADVGVSRVVLHEPPFGDGSEQERERMEGLTRQLMALLGEDRRGDAVELHLNMTGVPPEMIEPMRSEPYWANLEANAPTIAYDWQLVSRPDPAGQAAAVTCPTLVLVGGASPQWMIDKGKEIAGAVPQGRHQVLEGQHHVVPPHILVPALTDFLS